jgi:hypothetical protein
MGNTPRLYFWEKNGEENMTLKQSTKSMISSFIKEKNP